MVKSTPQMVKSRSLLDAGCNGSSHRPQRPARHHLGGDSTILRRPFDHFETTMTTRGAAPVEMRSRAAAPMPPRQFYSFSSSFITHVEMRSRAAAPTGARGRGGGVSIIPPADAARVCGSMLVWVSTAYCGRCGKAGPCWCATRERAPSRQQPIVGLQEPATADSRSAGAGNSR